MLTVNFALVHILEGVSPQVTFDMFLDFNPYTRTQTQSITLALEKY